MELPPKMNPFGQPLDTPLTDEQVVYLYRCLLGRDPESAQTIAWFKEEQATFAAGRDYLRRSEEFRINNPHTRQLQYYIPERFPEQFTRSSKRLVLATIVKNEAHFIENMLRSCAPILDYAVIIDTGSTDETMAIIRATMADLGLPFLLGEVPFVDFAQARNAALERVPKNMDWILMLDADEELVPADYWRFQPLLDAADTDAWHLPRYGFSDTGKRKPVDPYPDYQLRLLRNRSEDPIRFAGRVHERPHNVTWRDAPLSRCEEGIVGGPHIHHLGFMDITHERWQKKHDFYTSLQHAN